MASKAAPNYYRFGINTGNFSSLFVFFFLMLIINHLSFSPHRCVTPIIFLAAEDVMISTSSINRELLPPPYSRRGYRSTDGDSQVPQQTIQRAITMSEPPPYPGAALVIGATPQQNTTTQSPLFQITSPTI